jgi:hypothetical protein
LFKKAMHMKSIAEHHNVRQRRRVTVKDVRLLPVIGRHCRSSLERLERSYRECLPVAMLVSHSRFAPGYVVDSFLPSVEEEATVIRIAQSGEDPASFMDEVLRSIGFESRAACRNSILHLNCFFAIKRRIDAAPSSWCGISMLTANRCVPGSAN